MRFKKVICTVQCSIRQREFSLLHGSSTPSLHFSVSGAEVKEAAAETVPIPTILVYCDFQCRHLDQVKWNSGNALISY